MASPRTTVDLVTALVAGPAVWATGTSLGGAAHGAVAVEAVTVLVVVTFAQGAVSSGGYRPGMAATIVAATAVAGYLVLRPLLLLLRGRTEPGLEGLAFAVASRLVGAAALAAAATTATGGLRPGAGWPLGIAAGADAFLTFSLLGVEIRPLALWGRALLSEVHLGALLALLLVTALSPLTPVAALRLALVGHVMIASAVGTFGLLRHAAAAERRLGEDAGRDLARRHHVDRANWLHDEVLSEITAARLRVAAGSPEEVSAELAALDHRLRLRQLDESLEAPEVRLSEVVQPFLRRVRDLGITIGDAPTHEVAGLCVPGAAGRLARRVLAVATSNAVNAGTPWLAFRLRLDGAVLVVEVEDRAGGFDPASASPGRGLDRLRLDLDGGLLVVPATGGTLVHARIPLPDDREATT